MKEGPILAMGAIPSEKPATRSDKPMFTGLPVGKLGNLPAKFSSEILPSFYLDFGSK